jgi:7-cyano-7-deazaguanine synthase in queuosine biosynthesis
MKKVIVSADPREGADLHLVPGKNFTTGAKPFAERFGPPTSIEEDLLTVASSIYVTDLAVLRGPAENYIRDIDLTIEVVNVHAFERVKDDILHALIVLSNDNWTLNFTPKPGQVEPMLPWEEKEGAALLFSGGLDSFSGAARLLREGKPLLLVSHTTHNCVVEDSQQALLEVLRRHFSHPFERVPFRVFGRTQGEFKFPAEEERENSQRTRSFLFLALGALSARRVGYHRILNIAENGQFAIHLPLSAARVGPFSTHTAHPEFVHHMERLLRVLLNSDSLTIENPYLYMTKAEVVADLGAGLFGDIPASVSCWKASRVKAGFKHCGACVPCISRRISLEHLNIRLAEYQRDLFNEQVDDLPPDDVGKRNLSDLSQFIARFRGYVPQRKDDLLEVFFELYNDHFDQDRVIEMYARFSREAYGVLSKYPALARMVR